MERRLNFEGMISHLFLKAKHPNDQIAVPMRHKIFKEKEFTGLIRYLVGIVF